MMHHIWHLNELTQGNLGLACTTDGLFLGRTSLIERRGGRFVVRHQREIERLLGCAYQRPTRADQLMRALYVVASALNINDQCLARIAAVHLRIPDLPSHAARDRMETEDSLIKSVRRESTSSKYYVQKASPDDPKHPGWPAGTPGGLGGKFRPKDSRLAGLLQKIKDKVFRRELRMNLGAALHVGIEALAEMIPGINVAADVMILAEIAHTISEHVKLAREAQAALRFIQNAPYNLEDLQVSTDYKQFSSYDAFVKGQLGLEFVLKYFAPAGDGAQYHHLVTQGGANANAVLPKLQSTDNILILPTLLHEIVTDEYLSPAPDKSGKMLYQWLQTQPYEVQREYGLKILQDLHILK